ncbi:MAG: hypothetical protein M5U09_04455 [Gammaproteobacteria bacterium]|nr:hypothetical protein [Gammaproteobacteria bacterium]
MSVRGLAGGAERVVHLDGGRQPQRYLKAVRELLSSIALGSPGGYPLVLGRWTRTGQLHNLPLEKLLRLAEPEAVVAVAIAGNLTADMARLASVGQSDHRDRPLPPCPRRRAAGRTRPRTRRAPARAPAVRDRGDRRRAFRSRRAGRPRHGSGRRRCTVAPRTTQERDLAGFRPGAAVRPSRGRRCRYHARKCLRPAGVLLSARGRILFSTVESILSRPADPEIVVECLDTLSSLLARIRPAAGEFTSIENIERRVADAGPAGDDDTSRRLRAIAFLSLAGEPLVRDHFARSTAVGSLMRRQLAPLLDPVCRELAIAAAGRVVP